MKKYTIPEGYIEVEEIAVGDFVFSVFGIDECYHSGPFEVTSISGPRLVDPNEFVVSVNPGIRALVGRPTVTLRLAVCPDSPEWMQRQKREQGWCNFVHKEGGVVKIAGGRLLVKRNRRAPLVQGRLIA